MSYKPRPIKRWNGTYRAHIDRNGNAIICSVPIDPVDARRVAAWLTKYAQWARLKRKAGGRA